MDATARGHFLIPFSILAVIARVVAASAQTTLQPPAAVVAESAAARALAVFEKHCAGCHQGDRLKGGPAGGAFGNILVLDEIAREPEFVRPGLPDASGLYHMLLSRHRGQAVYKETPGGEGPNGDEIGAVRDWIETLPENLAACPDRPPMTAADAGTLADQWSKAAGTASGDIRFVSLVHLYNACQSDSQIAAFRDAIGLALGHLAGRDAAVQVETIGDLSVIVAFKLNDAGLTAGEWDEIVRADPRQPLRAATGDWLVAHASAKKPHPTTVGLTRLYNRDVGMLRATAEFGGDGTELASRLASVEGPDARLVRRLRQGAISRPEWETLYRILEGRTEPTGPIEARLNAPLRLALWSDKISYKSGDLAAFTASASGDCHLTLIGIDKAGIATVLFPNDFERNNLLRGGATTTIPVQGASYQLRLKEQGREIVAGICTSPGTAPEGVIHDFEKQRFTVLGPWQVFLETTFAGAGEPAHTSAAAARARSRNGAKSAAAPTPPLEARAAIAIRIE